MAAVAKLVDILQQKDALADPSQWLHREEVQEGLKALAGILADGVAETGDEARGFQRWSNSQLQAILYVSQAVVAVCHSLRDQDEKSLIARIFELAVEFCVCYLEHYALDWAALDQQGCLPLQSYYNLTFSARGIIVLGKVQNRV